MPQEQKGSRAAHSCKRCRDRKVKCDLARARAESDDEAELAREVRDEHIANLLQMNLGLAQRTEAVVSLWAKDEDVLGKQMADLVEGNLKVHKDVKGLREEIKVLKEEMRLSRGDLITIRVGLRELLDCRPI